MPPEETIATQRILMISLGIVFGFACAFCHALSYLSTRSFVSTNGPRELLAIAHIQMAGISIILLPFLWIDPPDGWGPVMLPMAGAAGFYLMAQTFLFMTIQMIPASVVSPLLGLKLIPVAALGTMFFGTALKPAQFGAVALAGIAALCLFKAGEKLPPKAIASLGLACVCYSLSDLSIEKLIKALDPDTGVSASLFAVACEYTLCGLYGIYLYLRLPVVTGASWKKAIPFTITWYGAMCFLYAAIGLVGIVLAVILQATRGLISIGIGALIARIGYTHLEQKVSRNTRLRQVGAALLMFAAIVLFVVGKSLFKSST